MGMSSPLRNLVDDMKIHQLLLDPVRRFSHQSGLDRPPGVELALHQGDIDFVTLGESGNKLWLFHAEQIREDSANVIKVMPHGLSADTYARGAPELLHAIQACFLTAQKNVRFTAG